MIFQSIGIGYKRANPASVVSVQGYDPRPNIRVKASDSPSQSFRRYGFVDAVQELDPAGTLGLLDPDYKVSFVWFLSDREIRLQFVLCAFWFTSFSCFRVSDRLSPCW